MAWLVDHANTFYVLLGITAAGLVIAWRFNQRVKFLGFAVGVLALIGLLWLLTWVVPTDRKQLHDRVLAMSKAVVDGKVDELFKHISKDFQYKSMTRDRMYERTQAAVREDRIREVRIRRFKVEELSREKKFAKTSFGVTAWQAGSEQPYLFGTEADFVLEGEEWKLKTLRFYNPLVNQNQEVDLPLP